mmetsp:Transcript_46535/g.75624  ORF Transcript_46535/g.75624 Transcript_46535/m.75624 type:complete len:341 (-) Transcript_46535:129-1151(-)
MARWKTRRTARSDSPTYLLSSSGPLTAMKLAPLALAVALASSVLPQPGGPKRRTPTGTVRPSSLKSSALRIGSQTAASMSARTSCREPMSSQVTSGMVVKPSLLEEGCTLVNANVKSAISTARGASSSAVYGTARASPASPASPWSVDSCSLVASRPVKARLTAFSAASCVRAERSAPTNPGVLLARNLISRSSDRRMPPTIFSRILARAASSGMPMAISRSKRPARLSAGSSASGRFVAPRTTTCVFFSSSMQVSSWATIRRSISLPAESRFGVMESTSSIKRRLGAAAIAAWKSCLIFASDSPDMPDTISVAATRKNGTPVLPAMACASFVLPEPGGP